jgi:sulfur-carrier protein adenylyltransferase/sulfurtransferase
MMNTREKFTAVLISIGLIMALLPMTSNRSFTGKPQNLLSDVLGDKDYFTVDQVARFVVSEDSTVQLIDLRSSGEYMAVNIPGSLNVPYDELINREAGGFLNDENIRTIFYSNGDLVSNYAMVIAKGLNHNNVYVMKGGLNEWFNTVMNSHFTGDRITARENALFETRTRAGKLFTDINSLPDSLKIKYLEAKQVEAMKLDGGCE